MFGKKPQTPALTDRVRAIASRPSAPPASPPQPKARAARDSVFKQATITLDSGARLSVAIKDISAGGARIEFFHDIALEGEFTISEPMTRLCRRARVAWRAQGAAGLDSWNSVERAALLLMARLDQEEHRGADQL